MKQKRLLTLFYHLLQSFTHLCIPFHVYPCLNHMSNGVKIVTMCKLSFTFTLYCTFICFHLIKWEWSGYSVYIRSYRQLAHEQQQSNYEIWYKCKVILSSCWMWSLNDTMKILINAYNTVCMLSVWCVFVLSVRDSWACKIFLVCIRINVFIREAACLYNLYS